jgi:hypothetical protein
MPRQLEFKVIEGWAAHMNVKQSVWALLIFSSITACLITSNAWAATATLSDVTDFITRFGGYLFAIGNDNVSNTQYYWLQVSYTVNASGGSNTSGGGQSTSGGGQSTSGGGSPSSGGSSNITKIVKTSFRKVAVYKVSGNGTSMVTAPAASTAIANQLFPCAADNYDVETVTLDLRDITLNTAAPTTGTDNGHTIWIVNLQTSSGANLIRQNTQTLPANCPPNTVTPDASMKQADVSRYPIVFSSQTQADLFVKLLDNVIPTLNPPVLIPAPK